MAEGDRADGTRRRVRALLAAAALCALSGADAAETHSRFGFCAPPFAPPCADARAPTVAERKRCEAETERYVASVFAYRGCLAAETERAVREANATIRKVRCAKDPNLCALPEPDVDPETASPQARKTKATKTGANRARDDVKPEAAAARAAVSRPAAPR